MNTNIILQIAKETKEISDELFKCSLRNESLDVSPIGIHISHHPEVLEQVQGTIEAEFNPTIADIKRGERTRMVKTKYICAVNIAHYLGIDYEQANFLFNAENTTKKEFIDTITAFANKEIDIRECQAEDCYHVYTTHPEDKACVCDDCKDYLLEMCGM